jgi:Anti-sigma-K factor rskA
MNMARHETYKEMLLLEPLGGLDEGESPVLDQHLGSCAECQAELAELRDAAALLALAAPIAKPNPSVRSAILQSIGSLRANEISRSAAERSPLTGPRLKLRPLSFYPQNFLRLAAAIAFLALIIGVLVLWRRDVNLRNEVAQLSRKSNLERQQLQHEREALASEQDAVALLTGADTKKSQLSGTEVAKNARATLAFDRQTGRAVLVTEGLPPTPENKAYELWFIVNGQPLPGKVFSVDSSGRAIISHQVPAAARERSVFAITLEPEEGVQTPSGKVYLLSPSS